MALQFSPPDAIDLSLPSPVQSFTPDWKGAEQVSMYIKRDDLIHRIVSGNKWRKLKYTLRALPPDCDRIVSFGGGYSNHLHACAYVCHTLNVPFTAIVRGDYSRNPTPMLQDLHRWQADIQYVDKKTYQRREDGVWLSALQAKYPKAAIIPEGGSQVHALRGVAEIITETENDFDNVIVPVGSGATLAGLVTALKPPQSAMGIAVLKGQGYLESVVESLLPDNTFNANWHIHHDFHQGGYGKSTAALRAFCQQTSCQYGIPLEPVYSGKMFFAVKLLLEAGYFSRGARLLLVHTGGMQGAR